MTITEIYGKASVDDFEKWSTYPFDGFETYLTRSDFTEFQELKTTFKKYKDDIEVVHTPHVNWPEDKELLQQSLLLAEVTNAQVCFHSSYISLLLADKINNELTFPTTYGYESQNGNSYEFIKNTVFNNDLPFVYDLAHFYTGNPKNYLATVEDLLSTYNNQITLVHVCDATLTQDGLPLGKGELPVKDTWNLLEEYYTGPVTLEVIPDYQLDALEIVDGF